MKPEQMLDTLLSLPDLRALQMSRDGQRVAWTWFRAGPAADVLAAPTDGSAPPRRLTRTNENTYLVSWMHDSRALLVEQDRTVDDLALAKASAWAADDSLHIQGWLYRAGPSARRMVVYVHGGPSAHSQDQLNHQIPFLLRQGFNVLDPNYRGSTGFSLPFREAIKAEGFGGPELEDVRAGIEGHGISKPTNQEALYFRLEQFLLTAFEARAGSAPVARW